MIRKYCPELAKFDKKHIYEPWKAPIADQKRWGCRITGDGSSSGSLDSEHTYPKPMFDFNKRRETCLAGMKHAYGVGLHGNDTKVKDGSWKKDFGDDGEEAGDSRPAKRLKT